MAVLDTNVIIEIARGNREVLNTVLFEDNYFYITSIIVRNKSWRAENSRTKPHEFFGVSEL